MLELKRERRIVAWRVLALAFFLIAMAVAMARGDERLGGRWLMEDTPQPTTWAIIPHADPDSMERHPPEGFIVVYLAGEQVAVFQYRTERRPGGVRIIYVRPDANWRWIELGTYVIDGEDLTIEMPGITTTMGVRTK